MREAERHFISFHLGADTVDGIERLLKKFS